MNPLHFLADRLDYPPFGIRTLDNGACARVSPYTVKLATDPAAMTLLSVITTGDRDRAGDVVVPTGLKNAAEYLQNPVVLWAHNRFSVPPIGSCTRLDLEPDRIVAETKFAQGVSLAEDLFRLYEQGILRGWSIGFVPLVAKRLTPEGASHRRGVLVEEWNLLEYSAVPVPENPGALTVAIQKGIVHDGLLREWLSQVPDDAGGRWWRGGWQSKSGRALSHRNEERIKQACEHLHQADQVLQEVLSELDGDPSEPAAKADSFAELMSG